VRLRIARAHRPRPQEPQQPPHLRAGEI